VPKSATTITTATAGRSGSRWMPSDSNTDRTIGSNAAVAVMADPRSVRRRTGPQVPRGQRQRARRVDGPNRGRNRPAATASPTSPPFRPVSGSDTKGTRARSDGDGCDGLCPADRTGLARGHCSDVNDGLADGRLRTAHCQYGDPRHQEQQDVGWARQDEPVEPGHLPPRPMRGTETR
jgi:hypothetical protein